MHGRNCRIAHEMALQRAESSGLSAEVSVCFRQSGSSIRARRVESDPWEQHHFSFLFLLLGSQFYGRPSLMYPRYILNLYQKLKLQLKIICAQIFFYHSYENISHNSKLQTPNRQDISVFEKFLLALFCPWR